MTNKRELSFQLGIGTSASSAISDPEAAAEFTKLYNAVNLLAYKLDEYTGSIAAPASDRPYLTPQAVNKSAGVSRLYGEATVALVVGAIVNFTSSGKLELATVANGAHCIVLENTAVGDFAPVARNAVLTAFAGLTPGKIYYQSPTVAGGITLLVPSGQIKRAVGFAVNSSTLAFYPDNIGVIA